MCDDFHVRLDREATIITFGYEILDDFSYIAITLAGKCEDGIASVFIEDAILDMNIFDFDIQYLPGGCTTGAIGLSRVHFRGHYFHRRGSLDH